MNGKELLTQGHNKSKLGFVSSSTYKSDIDMLRQVSPTGERMGGVLRLPPSNTSLRGINLKAKRVKRFT
jgi:hypothetical protein